MTTPSNEQLKRALAKMTDLVHIHPHKGLCWFPYKNNPRFCDVPIRGTELLQIVWEIEETLSDSLWNDYERRLHYNCYQQDNKINNHVHATWQQRTIALAAIKDIEIV